MKILLLTQIVPYPPDSGPKIKTYNVLRYLALRHDVYLVAFARSAEEITQSQALRSYCAAVTTVPLRRSRLRDVGYLIRSLLTGRPFLIERDDSHEMRTALSQLTQRQVFDAVHADQLSMAQFAVDLPVPLRVLDEHNAVYTIVRRSALRDGFAPRRALLELEWRKLRAYEGKVCRDFDRVMVVSEEDRVALQGASQAHVPAKVIPIAIDSQELPYVPRSGTARRIVSVATMFYPPNAEGIYWFITEVFPRVRRLVPDAQFDVIGSRPPKQITSLALPNTGVNVTGYVADLEPVLRECAVLVVPVHAGSGIRVKILEAFARGIPVVSTRIGIEGIDARAGEHLLVADDPAEVAAAVARLLTNPVMGARLARAARALVEARYDWRTALRGLDDVYGTPVPNETTQTTFDETPARSAEPYVS